MVRTKKQVVDLLHKNRKEERKTFEPYSLPNHLHEPSFTINGLQPNSKEDHHHSNLQSIFYSLTPEEINEMLTDCEYKEDEIILRMITQTNYLQSIREKIEAKKRKTQLKCSKNRNTVNVIPSEAKQICKTSKEQVKTDKPPVLSEKSNKPMTRQHRIKQETHRSRPEQVTNGHRRLALDDALKQLEDGQNHESAFAGWSEARLRAYKMIDTNPNSYYYRFNAPGEQQRKGKWDEHENRLFMQRLSELGANSQWGIFSIAIPGRVGYQCSNYYRFMIESGHIQDPNYVLDGKGKARYLFDRKTEDGGTEKIFRKHSKHTTGVENLVKKKSRRGK
ncbi:MAG: hypothetical protein EXX96DRAFT_560874 [Benjaminiella poitrasii]|nr:MAG: hypothetical protein EXX96DRAFT_560874 [Benjaminiella poitrasii]